MKDNYISKLKKDVTVYICNVFLVLVYMLLGTVVCCNSKERGDINTRNASKKNDIKYNIIKNAVIDIDGNSYDAVKIGDQVWLAANLRTTKYADGTSIPIGDTYLHGGGYRYYPYGKAPNVEEYGYLYDWYAVMKGEQGRSSNPSGVQGVCPHGWHVPSKQEWQELVNNVECLKTNTVVKALASTTGWEENKYIGSPGYVPITNNTTGFNALPTGMFTGKYVLFGNGTMFWSATDELTYWGGDCNCDSCAYASEIMDGSTNMLIYSNYNDKRFGFSVRCIRDENDLEDKIHGDNFVYDADAKIIKNAVKDIDNNRYDAVMIGGKMWMAENLRTTRYANGTAIAVRYCPGDKMSNVEKYGYLYNWYGVMHNEASSNTIPSGVQGICPDGWHVPSDDEFQDLVNYLEDYDKRNNTVAQALASTNGWTTTDKKNSPGYVRSCNNSIGFNALPAGCFAGENDYFGVEATFWSATENARGEAYYYGLNYNKSNVRRAADRIKAAGCSVRCVKD